MNVSLQRSSTKNERIVESHLPITSWFYEYHWTEKGEYFSSALQMSVNSGNMSHRTAILVQLCSI